MPNETILLLIGVANRDYHYLSRNEEVVERWFLDSDQAGMRFSRGVLCDGPLSHCGVRGATLRARLECGPLSLS